MRPYPWKCGTCGKRAVEPVVTDYSTDMDHDGRSYSLTVPSLELLECKDGGARVLPNEAHEKIVSALRQKVGLLNPEEIRERRKALGLNQEALASYLRVAKETISRWETGGQIQQRAMDLLLRAFFEVPQVRYWLEHPTQTNILG
jgi:putative zinc finger/helix-turn-helix YgiT family protein